MKSPYKIPLFNIDFGKEEIKAIYKIIRSGWVSLGPESKKFEQEFADFYGRKHAIFTTNGTSALHLAYIAAGVKKKDRVILPSFTYISTVTPLFWIGAEAVFCDIESLEKPLISANTINSIIDKNIKAIVFVPYAGFMDGIDEIKKLAEAKGIILIEDASHAHGSEWKGETAGGFGVVAGMSLYANKNMTTGEGGMVLTDDDSIAEKVRKLRSQGMTTLSYDRYTGLSLDYDIEEIGYNYRPTEIQAAIGRVQLKKLNKNNQRRKELVKTYRELLKDIEEIIVPFEDYKKSANYIFPIFVPRRDEIRIFLHRKGIQTSVHYKPIHKFHAVMNLLKKEVRLPVTEKAGAMELTLPLYPQMREKDVKFVVESLKDAIIKTKNS